MWIMTKYGFFSAVCARQGDGGYGQPVDPDRIMVRARDEEHLRNLMTRFPEVLREVAIHTSDQSDYPCRIFIGKAVWADILQALAHELDYDNFKSEVARVGITHERFGLVLSRVWGVLHGVTPPSGSISDFFTDSTLFPVWKQDALDPFSPTHPRDELESDPGNGD